MQGIMWRCIVVWTWCFLGGVGFAGNRADVNADQNVDALDLAELSNVLAGNLDMAAYELENVVVVAENGGDFQDPADAADWVTSQNPSTYERYVILICPGQYTLNRTLVVPEYTIVKGYGFNVTSLVRYANGIDGAVVKFQGPTAYQMRIEELDIYNGGDSSPGPVIGVLVEDCRPEIGNCKIRSQTSGGSYDAIGMRVTRSSELTNVIVKNTSISGVSTASSGGLAIGVELLDSSLFAYDSSFHGFQYSDTKDGIAVAMERTGTSSPILHAYNSEFRASGDPGFEFYLFRYGTFGTARFHSCRIDSDCQCNISLGSGLKLSHCFDMFFDPFP